MLAQYQTPEEIVQGALKLYPNYDSPATVRQLAILAGFESSEKYYADVFMDILSSESEDEKEWFYISNSLIRKWFLSENDQGKEAVRKINRWFIQQNHAENTEWKNFSHDSEMVKKYMKLFKPFKFPAESKSNWTRKMHLGVSKDMLRKLLWKYNKKIHKIYKKTEDLVPIRKTYLEVLEHRRTRQETLDEDVKCDPEVRQALVKFNYEPVEAEDLSYLVGFSEDERKMLSVYWQPAFNNSWIYLSPEMITKDMGYAKVSDFYRDTLRKHYQEGTDYKEVSEDDEMIKSYKNLNADQSAFKKVPHKRGKAQKYYLVTGKTLKKMLMRSETEKGRKTRDYYIKVEELAMFMYKYISAMHQFVSNREKSDLQKQLDAERAKNARIIQYISNINPAEKNHTLYIVSTKRYIKENVYKIGHVASIEKKALKSRLCTYNTGHPSEDKFFFVYLKKVYNASDLDHKLKKALCFFKSQNDKNKETVLMNFEPLKKIVDKLAERHNEEAEMLNSYIQDEHLAYSQMEPAEPDEVKLEELDSDSDSDEDIEVNRRKSVDVSEMREEEMKKELKKVIKYYIRKEYNETFDYDDENDKNNESKSYILKWMPMSKPLMTSLRLPHEKRKLLMPEKWKPILNAMVADSVAIRRVKYHGI